MRRALSANKPGFASLLGILITVVIMCILSYILFKVYFQRPAAVSVDKETSKTLQKQGIDSTNYQTIIDSTRKKLDEFNKEQERRFDQMDQMF